MENNDNLSKWINDDSYPLDHTEGKETLEKIKEYSAQLEAPSFHKEKVFKAIKTAQQDNSKSINRSLLLKIAAVLVIVLGSIIFFALSDKNAFETSYAQSKTIDLPDTSKVTLFPGSQMEFNEAIWGFTRSLTLEGEAFFKVAKGETFTVKTVYGNVKVLGTQFLVKAIDGSLVVVCYEGKVNVSAANRDKIITANEYILIKNNTFIEKQQISLKSLPTEATYYKVINENFADVIKDIERYYDVNIEAKGITTQKTFTGNIPKENLQQALQIVAKTFKLKYESIGKNSFIFVGDAEN